jgi:uncharacterized Zn finger protein (UPF0148 family)
MSAHCDKCDTDLWQDSKGNFICPVCTKDTRIQEKVKTPNQNTSGKMSNGYSSTICGSCAVMDTKVKSLELEIVKYQSRIQELEGEVERLGREVDAYRITGKPMEAFQELLIKRDKLESLVRELVGVIDTLKNQLADRDITERRSIANIQLAENVYFKANKVIGEGKE